MLLRCNEPAYRGEMGVRSSELNELLDAHLNDKKVAEFFKTADFVWKEPQRRGLNQNQT